MELVWEQDKEQVSQVQGARLVLDKAQLELAEESELQSSSLVPGMERRKLE